MSLEAEEYKCDTGDVSHAGCYVVMLHYNTISAALLHCDTISTALLQYNTLSRVTSSDGWNLTHKYNRLSNDVAINLDTYYDQEALYSVLLGMLHFQVQLGKF